MSREISPPPYIPLMAHNGFFAVYDSQTRRFMRGTTLNFPQLRGEATSNEHAVLMCLYSRGKVAIAELYNALPDKPMHQRTNFQLVMDPVNSLIVKLTSVRDLLSTVITTSPNFVRYTPHESLRNVSIDFEVHEQKMNIPNVPRTREAVVQW